MEFHTLEERFLHDYDALENRCAEAEAEAEALRAEVERLRNAASPQRRSCGDDHRASFDRLDEKALERGRRVIFEQMVFKDCDSMADPDEFDGITWDVAHTSCAAMQLGVPLQDVREYFADMFAERRAMSGDG